MNKVISSIKWHLKQIIPMEYSSYYGEDGKKYISRWKMWFGYCYNHRKYEVLKEVKL
jgi:hypothetical protein